MRQRQNCQMRQLRSTRDTSQVLIPQHELLDVVQRPVAARLEAQRFGGFIAVSSAPVGVGLPHIIRAAMAPRAGAARGACTFYSFGSELLAALPGQTACLLCVLAASAVPARSRVLALIGPSEDGVLVATLASEAGPCTSQSRFALHIGSHRATDRHKSEVR